MNIIPRSFFFDDDLDDFFKPVVRKNDVSKDADHPIGIEIYEVVDMDTEITDEEILEVYKELREAGIKWTDIKRENLGRLRKDNYPHEIGHNVPVPPEMLGIQESGVERKILKLFTKKRKEK